MSNTQICLPLQSVAMYSVQCHPSLFFWSILARQRTDAASIGIQFDVPFLPAGEASLTLPRRHSCPLTIIVVILSSRDPRSTPFIHVHTPVIHAELSRRHIRSPNWKIARLNVPLDPSFVRGIRTRSQPLTVIVAHKTSRDIRRFISLSTHFL